MSVQDRPLSKKAIIQTLAKKQSISQTVNYTPKKEYEIDRLHRQADKILSASYKY